MKAGYLDGKLSTRQVILNAEEIFHRARWSTGVVYCPYCGEVHKVYTCKIGYKCGKCGRRFTDRTKTLLHGSKLGTDIWMQGLYEVFTDNFIPSTQLAIKLHINQKSAWLMLSKIRMGLLQKDYTLRGIIAQDEMFIGGSLSNMHYDRKQRLIKQYRLNYYKPNTTAKQRRLTEIFQLNDKLKQPVFGMNDGTNIVLYATPNPIKQKYIRIVINNHADVWRKENNTMFICDESWLYSYLSNKEVNIHKKNQYVTESGYTSNPIENTFSWYKRGFNNLTHCVYHQLYLNEFVFRKNTRYMSHTDRFKEALKYTLGKTITYKDIRAYRELPFKQIVRLS